MNTLTEHTEILLDDMRDYQPTSNVSKGYITEMRSYLQYSYVCDPSDEKDLKREVNELYDLFIEEENN